jgi:hypothetical protein
MSDSMVADSKHEEHGTPLEQDTAAYFDWLPEDVQAEESSLGVALAWTVDETDFDG